LDRGWEGSRLHEYIPSTRWGAAQGDSWRGGYAGFHVATADYAALIRPTIVKE
jgi:hypothetical protein